MRYLIMHIITTVIDNADLPIDAAEDLISVLQETISILEVRYGGSEMIGDCNDESF